MFQIAIVGAGQIGSRHLQAMSLFDRPVCLQIVDPDAASLTTAEERFNQCAKSPHVLSVDFLRDIADLPGALDLVIVATSANVRRAVVETLLAHKVVRYMILEKVLFQKIEDLDAVGRLLQDKNVVAWVNCPFRMVPFYQSLKARFKEDRKLDYAVTGSLMGIGCNSIHYLDMCAFFSGDWDFALTPALLDEAVIASKRPGFVEFTGTLAGLSAQGSRFAITSYADGEAPVVITITSSSMRCVIRENEGKCWSSDADSNWVWREEVFLIPYQSQMSHLAVGRILESGICDLTTYAESVGLHKSLLDAFATHLQQHASLDNSVCPIT
jgi:hypothetical protein